MSEDDDAALAEEAWAKELERRARRALAGESDAWPWSEAEARLRSTFAKN